MRGKDNFAFLSFYLEWNMILTSSFQLQRDVFSATAYRNIVLIVECTVLAAGWSPGKLPSHTSDYP